MSSETDAVCPLPPTLITSCFVFVCTLQRGVVGFPLHYPAMLLVPGDEMPDLIKHPFSLGSVTVYSDVPITSVVSRVSQRPSSGFLYSEVAQQDADKKVGDPSIIELRIPPRSGPIHCDGHLGFRPAYVVVVFCHIWNACE